MTIPLEYPKYNHNLYIRMGTFILLFLKVTAFTFNPPMKWGNRVSMHHSRNTNWVPGTRLSAENTKLQEQSCPGHSAWTDESPHHRRWKKQEQTATEGEDGGTWEPESWTIPQNTVELDLHAILVEHFASLKRWQDGEGKRTKGIMGLK